MTKSKYLIWRYDGDPSSEENEFDREGEIEIPRPGAQVVSKGKTWDVVHVTEELTISVPTAAPTRRIFLKSRRS